MKTTHIVYYWKSGKTFFVSLRTRRNKANSIVNGKYKSQSGQWKAAERLSLKYAAQKMRGNPNK